MVGARAELGKPEQRAQQLDRGADFVDGPGVVVGPRFAQFSPGARKSAEHADEFASRFSFLGERVEISGILRGVP